MKSYTLDVQTKEAISQNKSISEIEELARLNGFRSMRYDGLKKVLRGLTTIDEVNHATAVG